MKSDQRIRYFVEGECEEKLINTYKLPPYNHFVAGKVDVVNFIFHRISNQRLASLEPKTIVVLVYDIDVERTEILDENIKKLKSMGIKTYHVQSIKNFEEELSYSTGIKDVKKIFGSQNIEDFKNRFIHQGNLHDKLMKNNFEIKKIWFRINTNKPFNRYSNEESLKAILSEKSKM